MGRQGRATSKGKHGPCAGKLQSRNLGIINESFSICYLPWSRNLPPLPRVPRIPRPSLPSTGSLASTIHVIRVHSSDFLTGNIVHNSDISVARSHKLVFVIVTCIIIASKMLFDTPLSSALTLFTYIHYIGCTTFATFYNLGIPVTTTPHDKIPSFRLMHHASCLIHGSTGSCFTPHRN